MRDGSANTLQSRIDRAITDTTADTDRLPCGVISGRIELSQINHQALCAGKPCVGMATSTRDDRNSVTFCPFERRRNVGSICAKGYSTWLDGSITQVVGERQIGEPRFTRANQRSLQLQSKLAPRLRRKGIVFSHERRYVG
jgi:hypothetical protein